MALPRKARFPHRRPAVAALAPDGTFLVAGYTTRNGDDDCAVARFAADGKVDKSPASTGMLAFGTSADDSASAVLGQPDGRIVLGGDSGGSESSMAVARREHDGSPDQAFGSGGTAVPDFDGEDAFAGVALQGDGKLLLAGTTLPDYRFAAGGGNDIVCGGSGNDRIAGGRGRDVLLGGSGRDRLTGGPQRDRCLGGGARDRASACESKRAL